MTADHASPNGSHPPARLRAERCQLVDVANGVLLVRGATEVKVLGDRAREVVGEVLVIAGAADVTASDIAARFAAVDRDAIDDLVRYLLDRRILVEAGAAAGPATTAPESAAEIFYWNFELSESEATARLRAQTMVVLGVNAVSARLVPALQSCGVPSPTVVDVGLLRNQRIFGDDEAPRLQEWPADAARPISYREWLDDHDPDALDGVVLTSDVAATSVALEWNRVCLARGLTFLPVILRRLIGHVGPFVVPGQTACYQCMVARENAHLQEHELLRASEDRAPFGQATSGTLPPMASILGDIAALEIIKFHTRAMPPTVGRRIDVNLILPSLETRHVLRAPRCPTCAPAARRPASSLERVDFAPGPQFAAGDGVDTAAMVPDALRSRVVT